MPNAAKVTSSLPAEQVAYIDGLAAAGPRQGVFCTGSMAAVGGGFAQLGGG